MDLSAVVRFYVERMLKETPGMKVLLLDADTTKIVSTVYSQSEILEQEVYLVERLDADRRDQLFHLKASVISTCQTVTKAARCHLALVMLSAGSVLPASNQREHSKDTQRAERTMLRAVQPMYAPPLTFNTVSIMCLLDRPVQSHINVTSNFKLDSLSPELTLGLTSCYAYIQCHANTYRLTFGSCRLHKPG